MVHLTDTNIDQILSDPGTFFERPNTLKQASLSRENKLRVLEAWRQWLLSPDMHADQTDEKQVNNHLAEIDGAIAAIEDRIAGKK